MSKIQKLHGYFTRTRLKVAGPWADIRDTGCY
jgi:hypothetical protein